MKRTNWSREELILAFNLYLKLPFGKMHKGNPEIMHLAKIVGRTPSSVAMRLSNFASIDPYHQKRGIIGLPGGAKQCQPIWDKFMNNRQELLFESERILAEWENQTLESKYSNALKDIEKYKGEMKVSEVKARVNQNIFRQIVLAAYSNKCAITGIDIVELLVASHIIPWSKNEKERLNPENGICLSVLYDVAFDRGFIGVTTDYKLIFSNSLKKKQTEPFFELFFKPFEGHAVSVPDRFKPKKEFLEYHFDTIFLK